MKKVMLIGRTSCGKTTFCQALYNMELKYKKTQMVEVIHNAIDTPGEYVENRSLYRALVVTSADADAILLVQDCSHLQTLFAPAFATMFNSKPVVGMVSKIDLAPDEQTVQAAEECLRLAGADPIFKISSVTGQGIDELRTYLEQV